MGYQPLAEPRTLSPIQKAAEGVLVRVKVQPRASRNEIAGLHGGAIRIRLTAPPVDGEANEELVRFLAAELSVPRRAVRLVSGRSGRSKILLINGLHLDEARHKLGL